MRTSDMKAFIFRRVRTALFVSLSLLYYTNPRLGNLQMCSRRMIRRKDAASVEGLNEGREYASDGGGDLNEIAKRRENADDEENLEMSLKTTMKERLRKKHVFRFNKFQT